VEKTSSPTMLGANMHPSNRRPLQMMATMADSAKTEEDGQFAQQRNFTIPLKGREKPVDFTPQFWGSDAVRSQ
jgi:hypothetical protein